MKLTATLPPKYEKKWNRISAYMGKDIDALLIEGIDYVWNNFGKDIVQNERQAARYARKIKQAEQSLSKQVKNDSSPFVGSYERKVNSEGIVRLPKCWLDMLADPKKIYCIAHGKRAISLFAENEFAKCDEVVRRKAVALPVNFSGCVKLDGCVRGFSCTNKSIVLRGQLRNVQVEVLQTKQ